MKKITIRIPKKKTKDAIKLLETNNIKNYLELSSKKTTKIEIITSGATAEKTAAMLKDGLGIGKSLEEGLIEISDTTVYSPYMPEKTADHIMEKEMDARIKEFSKLDMHYVSFIILSSLIATMGVALNNELILIGSMLVSPLMLPMMSTSFSIVSKKKNILKQAFETEFMGVFIVFITAAVTTLLLPNHINVEEISMRVIYSNIYIPLAVVLGIVAAYSFATDKARNLTGVAIAVSLLPPLVISVLLIMKAQFMAASQAMIIFLINAFGIHMSSIAVFIYLKTKAPAWYKYRGV
jgi:uncharacterized hydrophobic protein (TIGR00341 family)